MMLMMVTAIVVVQHPFLAQATSWEVVVVTPGPLQLTTLEVPVSPPLEVQQLEFIIPQLFYPGGLR